jgi:hypothetical protein
MTPRSLFNIILKVLGLFFLQDFLAAMPQLFSVFLFLSKADTLTEAVWTLAASLLTLLAYGITSYYLIFKSGFLIDKLKLDKGFDQEVIPLNMHRSAILSISIIVIGGLMVANEIPNLCRQLFSYYQEKRLTFGMTHSNISYSIFSAVKLLIGILLIVNQQQIVHFIEWKRKR